MLIGIDIEFIALERFTFPPHFSVKTATSADIGAKTAIVNTWRISKEKGE